MNFKYNLQLSVSAILFQLPAFVVNGFTADTYVELNPNRIAEIESLLPEQPAGFGRPASDQEFWTRAQTRTIAGDSVAATDPVSQMPQENPGRGQLRPGTFQHDIRNARPSGGR